MSENSLKELYILKREIETDILSALEALKGTLPGQVGLVRWRQCR